MCAITLTGQVWEGLGKTSADSGLLPAATRLLSLLALENSQLYMCAVTQTRLPVSGTLATPVLSESISRHQDLNAQQLLVPSVVFRTGGQLRRERQAPDKSRPPPIRNRLLAPLPDEEHGRLLPRLEPVPLPFMGVIKQ